MQDVTNPVSLSSCYCMHNIPFHIDFTYVMLLDFSHFNIFLLTALLFSLEKEFLRLYPDADRRQKPSSETDRSSAIQNFVIQIFLGIGNFIVCV